MAKTRTINLNQNEISNFINELDKWAEKLTKVNEKVIDELAEIGLEEMQKNYGAAEYKPLDGMNFTKTGTEQEKTISMQGTQAVYMEFGTGTYGEQNPHPQKEQMGLNPYNSGRTIRRNNNSESTASQLGIPQGELYWTYKDENGIIHYTQGIPAQKIVYDATKTIKEKIPSVCKKAIEEVLK